MSDDFNPFPFGHNREGGTIGLANENRMLQKVGGANTIRKTFQNNADGSTTMLHTRGSGTKPEFITDIKKDEDEPTTPNFQGVPVSQAQSYGLVDGVAATSATAASDLTWCLARVKNGDFKTFTKKKFVYHGNVDWRDTRPAGGGRVFKKVVTWHGFGSIGRCAPLAYPAYAGEHYITDVADPGSPAYGVATVGVENHTFLPFDKHAYTTAYDGIVWVDGVEHAAVPGIVFSACLHKKETGETVLRALAATRSGVTVNTSNMSYRLVDSILLYEKSEAAGAWTNVGALAFNGFMTQTPLFNSSGTEFTGLMRDYDAGEFGDCKSWYYTCGFANGATMTRTDGGTRLFWARYTNGGLNFTRDERWSYVTATDYVGDTLVKATHKRGYYEKYLHVEGSSNGSGIPKMTWGSELDAELDAHVIESTAGYTPPWTAWYFVDGQGITHAGIIESVTIRVNGVPSSIITRLSAEGGPPGYPRYEFRWVTPGTGDGHTSDNSTFAVDVTTNGLLNVAYENGYVRTAGHWVYPSIAFIGHTLIPQGPITVHLVLDFSSSFPDGTVSSVMSETVVDDKPYVSKGRVSSIDLRSRTFTTTAFTYDETTGQTHAIEDATPGSGGAFAIGSEPSWDLTPYTPIVGGADNDLNGSNRSSTFTPLAALYGAPLGHASDPDGGMAIVTIKSSARYAYKTVKINSAGVTELASKIPSSGANQALISQVFFKRRRI